MSRKRVLVLSPLPGQVIEALLAASAAGTDIGEVEAVAYEGESRQELLEAVAGADIIVGDYTTHHEMDAEVMRAAAPCALIQQPSVGYQHLDVDEAARQGIPVANAAGANAISVAEHTIMGALSCLKKLTLQQKKMRESIWAQDEMAEHGIFELFGKTLGIIGLGRIGKQVAARAKPFGCNTIYYDIVRPDEGLEAELCVSFRELDELVAESDILCLHVPLTPDTRHMIDAARVAGMKQGAILVNVARGEVIDEDAVAAALKEGRLAGAVIDVFSEEPVPPDNPLLDCPNTVLTPHTAGATNESRLRIINVAMGNIVKVLKGEPPENVVNGVTPGQGS
jgi:phosphoglycerate dehydrogenase-like enzyme